MRLVGKKQTYSEAFQSNSEKEDSQKSIGLDQDLQKQSEENSKWTSFLVSKFLIFKVNSVTI